MPDCGTRSCYISGCRCAGCRRANTDYQRRRRTTSGRVRSGTGLVDAGPVTEHLRALGRSGVGLRTVAASSGVSRDQLVRIRSGAVPRVQRATAHAVLAVPAVPAATALVDAAAARRLLADLRAAGWTTARIAAGLGRTGRTVSIGRRKVTASTHRALVAMWELECRHRPHGTAEQYRQGCRCSRCRAAAAAERADYRAGRAPNAAPGDVEELYEQLAGVVLARREPWRASAACAGMPVATMMPLVEPDASVHELCAGCPVRDDCAAARHGSSGVWGGVWYPHDDEGAP